MSREPYLERITVFSANQYDAEWFPENLSEAINWLSSKLADIPLEYQSAAIMEIDNISNYDDHEARIIISYTRPPTIEELSIRKEREQQAVKLSLEWARKRVLEEEQRAISVGLKL